MRKDGHAPLLIVIAGPNGSGKTTITTEVLASEWLEDAVYINPDIVAQEKFGNWNSPEAVREAALYCEKWRENCLAKGKSLIFETVMSAHDKIGFIRRAKQAGYFVRIFFISTNQPDHKRSAYCQARDERRTRCAYTQNHLPVYKVYCQLCRDCT